MEKNEGTLAPPPANLRHNSDPNKYHWNRRFSQKTHTIMRNNNYCCSKALSFGVLTVANSNKFDLWVFLNILFIFRKHRREGQREGEKHQCVVASGTPPTWDLAHNQGMCSDWEWNRQPFGS